MGFDQNQRRRVFDLRFREFPGLTVSMRKPGFAALEQLSDAVLVLGDDLDGSGKPISGTTLINAWYDLFSAFADSLVGWDLIDDGRAVPATRDGVFAQDLEFLSTLTRVWYRVVVPAPNQDPPEVEESNAASTDPPMPDEPELTEDDMRLMSFRTVTAAPSTDDAKV
jgi:hypothetical protein